MRANFQRVFTRHPASVGESYAEHLRFALGTGARLIAAGLAAIAHGLVPCLFERTSSTTVLRLARGMRARFPLHPTFHEEIPGWGRRSDEVTD